MGEEDERFSAGADSAGRGADRVRAARVDPVARRTQGREGHDRRVADAGGVCKKSGDLVRERQAVKFAAIADWADSNSYPVAFMCVELGVSRSGYYAWRTAAPSQRSKDDTTLIAIMKKLHAEARGNPGLLCRRTAETARRRTGSCPLADMRSARHVVAGARR